MVVKNNILALLLFVSVILFVSNPLKVQAAIDPIVETCSSTINTPKYFGYYWGMSGISEVSSYVNAMFIGRWGVTDVTTLANSDIQDLNTLDSLGIKGVVDLAHIFFVYNSTEGKFHLYSNWEQRWNDYWYLMYPHLGKIAAFYPVDEPDGVLSSYDDYYKVVHIIKINVDSTQYDIPILMVVTASGVLRIQSGELGVPPGISWLGFDEYHCWGSECFGGLSIPEKVDILTNQMRSRGGKIVLVPDSVAFGIEPPSEEEQSAWVLRLEQYYQLCKDNDLCVGMFAFLWGTLPNNQLIGAESMPLVEQKLKTIGREIKDCNSTPAPTLSGDINGDGIVNIQDYILLSNAFGTNDEAADLDDNGIVNIQDYIILSNNFGKTF